MTVLFTTAALRPQPGTAITPPATSAANPLTTRRRPMTILRIARAAVLLGLAVAGGPPVLSYPAVAGQPPLVPGQPDPKAPAAAPDAGNTVFPPNGNVNNFNAGNAAGATNPGGPGGGLATRISRQSVLELFTEANPMLWPLVICSVVTVGFCVERWFALRRGRVIPREFVNRFLERLTSGRLDQERALELCKAHESPVARIFAHIVKYWGQPAATIRQAVALEASGEIADLKKNVRILNGTATLAPLLGLLGTVVGLIQAFDVLGAASANNSAAGAASAGAALGGTKSELLAHGISLALVATAFGLVIAVASITMYYYFLHKIDTLVRELDDHSRSVVDLIAAEPVRAPTDRRPLAESIRQEIRAN